MRRAPVAPINCLIVPGNPLANAWLSFVAARPAIVSAAPSKTSAPVGSIVPVNGSVRGGPFNAQPAYKGTIPYRVYVPACRSYVAGVSKAFSIRGT